MCLGGEAQALRTPLRPRLAQLPVSISPTGPMSSGTQAASCWHFLLTGQKLFESLRLPVSTPTPASQSRPPSTDPLPVASSPSSHPPAGPSMLLVTMLSQRTDSGASGRDTRDRWEREQILGAGPWIGRPFASLGLSFPKCWPTLERMKDAFRSCRVFVKSQGGSHEGIGGTGRGQKHSLSLFWRLEPRSWVLSLKICIINKGHSFSETGMHP